MCDTLVALTDDGVLFAKNSDRDPNESQRPTWHPAADHPDGSRVEATWISIDQVPHTHAVLLSRPWWMWGAEMGTNEHGVTIGNQAVFTKAPLAETGLLGMDLVRLALERSATASDAVQTIITLLEAHGQGGACSHEHPGFSYHNSFLVADRDGAIVLETAGSDWATETVTGAGRSISNGLTIDGFASANADRLRGAVAACRPRRHRTQAAAAVATDVADLFRALRDHGATVEPAYSRVNGGLGAPCVHAGGRLTASQTTASWVSDLRRTEPLHWITATSAPCTSLFKPVRVDEPVDLGPDPGDRFDPATLWWRHELLHRTVVGDHEARLARYRGARDVVETAWLADPPASTDAFAEADRIEHRWLADVLGGLRGGDRRPGWLRTLWEGWNRDAGLPMPPAPDLLDRLAPSEGASEAVAP